MTSGGTPLTLLDETCIRAASSTDAQAIANIYNHYVETTRISFEESPVSMQEMAERIAKVQVTLPWLVASSQDQVLGYAYATPWRTRSAYRFSAETSVYISHAHHGKGVGGSLYAALLGELPKRGIKNVIGGIAQPNQASVALHEKLGFKKVAHFSRVGFKFDQWVDVAYWQLELDHVSGP